jgi:hypothetical protein
MKLILEKVEEAFKLVKVTYKVANVGVFSGLGVIPIAQAPPTKDTTIVEPSTYTKTIDPTWEATKEPLIIGVVDI